MRVTILMLLIALILPLASQAEVTQAQAVEGLKYLFAEVPSDLAAHMVASATTDDATGKAYRFVLKRLIPYARKHQRAKSVSNLDAADRNVLKISDPTLISDPNEVFTKKISSPTSELNLNTTDIQKISSDQGRTLRMVTPYGEIWDVDCSG